MPMRPDDPDEPQPGDLAGNPADDTHDDVHPGGSADAEGPNAVDEIIDTETGAPDVDARFAEIVTHLRGAPDPRSWLPGPEVEADDEHFEPPEPGPVLNGDPLLTMAWCAVIGVLLLLVVVVIAWRDIPTIVLQAAGVVLLAGVGLLVWRMPRDRDDDSGPGAFV